MFEFRTGQGKNACGAVTFAAVQQSSVPDSLLLVFPSPVAMPSYSQVICAAGNTEICIVVKPKLQCLLILAGVRSATIFLHPKEDREDNITPSLAGCRPANSKG